MNLFRRKLKPDPLIRWFGKLPAYGDYYSGGGEDKWIEEFTQKWLMPGCSTYVLKLASDTVTHMQQSGALHVGSRLPVTGCILRLPVSGMTVLASCLDFGGDTVGRKFPLCFFVGVPAAELPGPPSALISPALGILSQLLPLGKKVANFLNEPGLKGPEQFRAQFGDREVSLDGLAPQPAENWTEKAKAIRMTDWYTATGDTLGAAGLEAWLERTRQWGDRLARSDSASFKAVLSLPLAPERAPDSPRLPHDIQVAGWFRWLENRIDLKERPISVVITEDPPPACSRLTVIVGELAPDDFLLLTPLAGGLEHVDNLASVRDEPAGESEAATDSAEQTLAPSASERVETLEPADPSLALQVSKTDPTALTWADFVGTGGQVELKV